MIILIALIGRNRELGVDGDLLWKIKQDLQYFKEKTIGKNIVMGRKTFDSIGKPLPGRRNIILSKNTKTIEGCDIFSNIDEVIKSFPNQELIFIGGGEIFAQAIKYADTLLLNIVNESLYKDSSEIVKKADAFFPEYENDFCIKEKEVCNEFTKYIFKRC